MLKLKSLADSVSSIPRSFQLSSRFNKPTRARSCSTGESNDIFHPKVLFKYPVGKDIDINGIAYMCFPDGAVPQRVVEKRFFKTVVLEDHKRLENSFVFLVTGNAKIRYGICVYKEIVAYQNESHVYIQPLCFCIITSLPFFQFHVDSLMSMLDMEGITKLHLVPPSKLSGLLRDALDASLSQANVPQCDNPGYSSEPLQKRSSPLRQQHNNNKDDKIDNNINDDNNNIDNNINDDIDEKDEKDEKVIIVDEDDENDEEISLIIDACDSEPPIDTPEDVEYKKVLLSIIRYCDLKLPPSRAPLVYFNITMSSVKK